MRGTKGRFIIGVDVGGTKISAGLVDSSGRILLREKIPTPDGSSRHRPLLALVEVVKNLLAGKGLKTRDIKGIGVGIAGLVDARKGRVLATPNMRLGGVNVVDNLRRAFSTKVMIGNDANLGILGEKWLGAAKGAHDVLGLFLGTGLGAGVIANNKLLEGGHGIAAEIGHLIVDPGGPRCSCGNRGCLEAFVGRWAIERDIRQALKEGREPRYRKLIKRQSGKIKSGLLRKALDRKDPVVTPIMKKSAEILGLACVSLRHIFDPEIIILGGGVVEACGDFIVPVVAKTMRKDKFFGALMPPCKVKMSKLGDDAVLLGAAALVKERLGERV